MLGKHCFIESEKKDEKEMALSLPCVHMHLFYSD